MGYACPVCGDPQADAGHLANHLAFTAITSGGDHEAWLDEQVPDWGQLGEAGLAELVVEHAERAEYLRVFDASGVEAGGSVEASGPVEGGWSGVRDGERSVPDEETRAILERARELTPRRHGTDDAGGTSDAEDPSDDAVRTDDASDATEADPESGSETE